MKITKTRQIVVQTPNKAGELAKVMGAIAKGGVNGLAYAGYAQAGKGTIMVVARNPAAAARALKKAGYKVDQRDVVLVSDKDRKGSAAAIARKVAAAKISLTQVYATSSGGEYLTVLQAKDTAKLIAALKK